MSAEAAVFEHIATTRLPQLQTAGGLFRATPRVDQVGEEDAGPDAGTLGAGAIVLLGLLRADEVGLAHPFSTGALRTRILGDLGGPGTDPGELGLTLWAESRADGGAIGEITKLPVRTDIARAKFVEEKDLQQVVDIRKTIDEQMKQCSAVA